MTRRHDKGNHPFSGARGSRIRTRLAGDIYADQGGKCAMCSKPITPTLRGKRGPDAPMLDHIRPWKLDDNRIYDPANLWIVCAACHGTCHSIEAAHWPDADMIEQVKWRSAERW